MTEQRIAACIITGDTYDEAEIKKLFASLEPHVHGIFIAYNGTKMSDFEAHDYFDQFLEKVPLHLGRFEWEQDFGKARQQSFDMVPRDEYDWYLWIDTDDIFVVEEENSVQEMFQSLDQYSQGIFLRYAYAVDPDSGIVVVEQWRERFLSTKLDWEWKHVIHEVCYSTGAQFARRDECFIQHQRQTGEAKGARPRNRAIIEKALREHPEESRYVFYYAAEALAEADSETDHKKKLRLIDISLEYFERYRMMVEQVSDDVYLATARMASLYRMKGDHANALQYDMECIAIYPDWPDAYVGAAQSCMEIGDWRRMKAFADMATKCNKPDTAASIEPMMAGFTPLLLRAIAEEELGEFENAIIDYTEAKKIWSPPENKIEDKIEELKERIVDPSKSADASRWDERKERRGTKPERSICFFTNPLPFVWHPKADAGAGAERAIMELAPMFAADGWRVAVFGTPGEYRGVDEQGIEWWNTDEFLPAEKFSILVSSRSPFPFTTPLATDKTVLWMHDVNIQDHMLPVKDKPTKIAALTKWHSQHLIKLYGISPSKLDILPNGINLERFPTSEWANEGDPPKFIWSSSADRGLDTILSLWPMIRDRFGNVELHVFYGWDLIDKILDMQEKAGIENTWLKDFRRKAMAQMERYEGERGGIYQHGRVGQEELAKYMLSSLIWPYTTGFMETFCITAIEMQAAGVIPVTSKLAALQETVSNPHLMIEGWPLNTDYQRRWLNLLDAVLADKEGREEQRSIGREHAEKFTWENAYGKWNDMFIDMGVKV